MALRIEDYALLSDTESAALVGRDGSIDWLTFPRFDSGACFAALLGTEDHGRWLIAPAVPVTRVERAYRPGTLVLDTTFHTAEGAITVTDCMPIRGEALDVVRLVRGVSGSVPMRVHLTVRFDTGAFEVRTAGHPPAVQRTAGDGRWKVLASEGPLLGLIEDADFTAATGTLRHGDAGQTPSRGKPACTARPASTASSCASAPSRASMPTRCASPTRRSHRAASPRARRSRSRRCPGAPGAAAATPSSAPAPA